MHWFIRDERKVNNRNTASKHRADFIADRQEAAVESLVSAKRAKVLTSAKSNLGAWRIGTKPVNRPTGTVNLLENQPSMEASLQKLSQSDIRCSNNSQLEMAIADFFHCDGVSFNLAGSQRFARVIHCARLVGDDFKIPHRHKIGGPLLDINFQTCYDANIRSLTKESYVFGLAFMSDGATVKRMPLVNVLGMCANIPPVPLAIEDCSGKPYALE